MESISKKGAEVAVEAISIWKPLAHYNERPKGGEIDTLVLHSMYAGGADRFSWEACWAVLDSARVSAHYLITREGSVVGLVPEERRAWHAGVSKMPFPFDERENVNHFSIGIELLGDEVSGFTSNQYHSLALLTETIMRRHPITSIVAHSDVSPDRKTDPWQFDWNAFRLQMLQSADDMQKVKGVHFSPQCPPFFT